MLQLAGAAKCFGSQTIFSDLNLSLEPGRFKVLVGPSGCGKSTLFDALTGVTPLDAGTLNWKGEDLPHLGGHAAYMQQKDLLLPWFTLLENSLLPARTGRRTPAAANPSKTGPTGDDATEANSAETRASRLFKRLGLAGFESHYPAQVSGGMRQRCALVRTLMFERELILLDEPLSALDAITRQGLQSLLLLLQSDFNRTILMITHDIEEALVLGDEIYLMSAAPMGITEIFRPSAPKPRRFDHPEIAGIKRRVLERLQGDLS